MITMIDIWGRPLSTLKKPDTGGVEILDKIKDVKKLIEDEIAETLSLASVDPGEIVIFGDRQGKLKTSNVSLDDILVKRRDAAEDTIALFSDQGKLKPGVLVSTITDKLATFDNTVNSLKSLNDKYDDHIVIFDQFSETQRNTIDQIDKPLLEFFGNPPVTTPKLTSIKDSMFELAALQSEYEKHVKQFSMFRKNIIDKFIGTPFDKIEITLPDIKKSIDDLKTFNDVMKDDATRMISVIEKIKIPHKSTNNIVYTIQHGSFMWTPTNNILNVTAAVKGIYRLTIVSPTQFNISSSSSSGVNNTVSTIIDKDVSEQFTITTADRNLARVSTTWYVEFVVDLSKQLN